MSQSNFVEYSNEWNISSLTFNEQYESPAFSPIPDVDLSFCFKFKRQILPTNGHPTQFELTLVKLKESGIPTSLYMNVNVSLCHLDGEMRHSYEPLTSIYVHRVNELTFDKILLMSGTLNYFVKYDLEFFDVAPTQSPSNLSETSAWSQDELKLFVSGLKSVYDTCLFSDVKFTIDEKTLPAHKVILAAHSPVFTRMLSDDFKESATNTIAITDSSYEVFSGFLKTLYSGEILDKSWANVKELYVLADKYDVAILKRQSQKIIPSLLSMDTVCDILIVAFTYDDTILKPAAMHFAITNMKNLIVDDEWKALVKSYPDIGHEITSNYVLKE